MLLNNQQTAPSFDALDPYPWFAWMRQHEGVYQDPNSSFWYVFGYEDVLRVLNPPIKPTAQDPIAFSSQYYDGMEGVIKGSIITIDPPRQRAVRELLNPFFSPKLLQNVYSARITAIIEKVLDQIIDEEEVDVVATLAYEIPVLVICELLGVATEDREKFKDWANQLVSTETLSPSVPELEQYFLHTIHQRRQHTLIDSSDAISRLVAGCPHDGVALSEQELLGNCVLLLVAGFETTAHLITNLFRILDTFPDVQKQVWQNPALVPALVEETLRYLSPVHFQMRLTTVEMQLGGKNIPEHQFVLPLLGSANRDERIFPEAESFELHRFVGAAPNHVAFGFRGTHFCLGAPLARLEAQLFMQSLIARVKQIRVNTTMPLQPHPASIGIISAINGVLCLPVTFQPR